jgi:hypothetical protein
LPERVQPDNATMVIRAEEWEWKGANAWIVMREACWQKSLPRFCLLIYMFAVLNWPKHNFLDTKSMFPNLLRSVIKSDRLIWATWGCYCPCVAIWSISWV